LEILWSLLETCALDAPLFNLVLLELLKQEQFKISAGFVVEVCGLWFFFEPGSNLLCKSWIQSATDFMACCGYLTFYQKVLIYTTHIKK